MLVKHKELTMNKANITIDMLISGFRHIHFSRFNTLVNDKNELFFLPYHQCTFSDGDVPFGPSYGIHISQLVRFARISF